MIPIRAYWTLLSDKLSQLKALVALMTFAVLISVALQVWAPQILKMVIDSALLGSDPKQVTELAIAFLIVAVLRSLFVIAASWLAEHVGWRSTNSLRKDLFEHVLLLDISFHKRYTPGELIQRVDGDITQMSKFFSSLVVNLGANVLLITGAMVLVFIELASAGILLLVVTILIAALNAISHPDRVRRFVAIRTSNAEAIGAVGEMFAGSEDISGNGARAFMAARFQKILARWLPRERQAWVGYGLTWSLQILWWALSTIGTFILAARALEKGVITVGAAIALIAYLEILSRPLSSLRQDIEALQRAGAAIERVEELRQITSAVPEPGNTALSSGPLGLRVKDLTFRYSDDPAAATPSTQPGTTAAAMPSTQPNTGGDSMPALSGIDFELAPGEVLGLIGRTGSGKSTLATLLTRLSVATAGTIQLRTQDSGDPNWVDISDVANIDDRISFVTQHVQLLRATLRDNLTFFAPPQDAPSDEQIIAALNGLGLSDWFLGLESGLDTEIDPTKMSAGQAQLVAFTRVFLDDPGLVVLDEASSRLDPVTERLLEAAVTRLLDGRTAVIIAHRLETLDRADSILILENGDQVEYGRRCDLVADSDSRFSRFLATAEMAGR